MIIIKNRGLRVGLQTTQNLMWNISTVIGCFHFFFFSFFFFIARADPGNGSLIHLQKSGAQSQVNFLSLMSKKNKIKSEYINIVRSFVRSFIFPGIERHNWSMASKESYNDEALPYNKPRINPGYRLVHLEYAFFYFSTSPGSTRVFWSVSFSFLLLMLRPCVRLRYIS